MAIPVPNLDDRRFQDLVDDAKRMVQARCPEWTDHNVSDPGVTLIETFAYMVDQLLYRLNRVPDRNFIAFLELIGVNLFPPAAARTEVTFRLSAPQQETVRVPVGTQVATVRNARNEALVYTVEEKLDIVPSQLEGLAASAAEGDVTDFTDTIGYPDQTFFCFGDTPRPGDALLVGLSEAVPKCLVLLRIDARIEGVGVNPDRPPLSWEAWTEEGWMPCELEEDGTGGLNQAGDVLLHIPPSHRPSVIADRRAGWLRCRLTPSRPGQRTYTKSPRVVRVVAATIGGTTAAANVERIDNEIVGVSDGVAGQRFPVRHTPIVPMSADLVVEVAESDSWEAWDVVTTFVDSGPRDRHVMIDAVTGEVVFGPAVREHDGELRHYGAVPDKDAAIRLPLYHSGGGRRGNVARGTLTVLKSSIPYITRVENRRPARGGVDGETVDEAKVRGPLLLRTRDRAVTSADYERLCHEVAPEVRRVRCVSNADDPGTVRLLVVPDVQDDRGRIQFEDLVPTEETLERIAAYLDARRCIGARVVVEPPIYQGMTVVARVLARRRADPERLLDDAREALYGYFNPLTGGPDGDGWAFGRPVNVGEVFAVMQNLRGTELVQEARLFAADPLTGARGPQVERIDIDPHALVYSFEHRLRVERAP